MDVSGLIGRKVRGPQTVAPEHQTVGTVVGCVANAAVGFEGEGFDCLIVEKVDGSLTYLGLLDATMTAGKVQRDG